MRAKTMNESIALVIDLSFGDRVTALAKEMPVWVVSSAVNDKASQQARQVLEEGRITILKTRQGERAEDLLTRALYAIDEHHGETSQVTPYDTLYVYGSTRSLSQEVLAELGFNSITATGEGFVAKK